MNYEEIEIKLNEAEEQNKAGNYEETERLCRELLESLVEGEELSLRVRVLRLLADILIRLGRATDAIPLVEEALAIREQSDDKQEQLKDLNLLGLLNNRLGDYSRALEYFAKGIATHDELGNKAGAAIFRANIGHVYYYIGDYTRALEYFAKANVTFEELGMKTNIAGNTGNIGLVHSRMDDYTRALEYYAKALAMHDELGNKAPAALVMSNIGLAHSEIGDYTRALEYNGMALAAFQENGMNAEAAVVTGNIGNVHKDMGDYSRALEYYAKALAAHDELSLKADTARVTGNIGSIYADKLFDGYNSAKAEEIYLKALALSEEIGAKHHIYHVHKTLADLYEQQKRWKKHSFHFKKYHEIYLEVQSEEATKQSQLMEHRRKIEEAERDRQIKLARFQEQEKILHNILPSKIAERMVAGEKTIVDSYQSVSVLFADIVGFTKLSQRITPEELVAGLDNIFNTFDHLTDIYGCEKIKTIGDCYMVVSGLPDPAEDHAIRLASLALEMIDAIQKLPSIVEDVKVTMRIGLHSGSVVAGIIGKNKYAYDLWGDAVNTASRMESHGEAGKIHVSEEFMNVLSLSSPTSPMSLHFQKRGEMDIKGKGMMKTYFLTQSK